jgi:hypothetical protein
MSKSINVYSVSTERCKRHLGFPKEKAELLRLQIKRKEFVGSWNIYVLVQKQETRVYKLLLTGW